MGVALACQAVSSARNAASRTAASGWVARPRTAKIGSVSVRPSACSTVAVTPALTSSYRRLHADEPVMPSSAASDSSGSDIWCSARRAALRSGQAWAAAAGLAAIRGSRSRAPSQASKRVRSAVMRASAEVRRDSSAWAASSPLSVLTWP